MTASGDNHACLGQYVAITVCRVDTTCYRLPCGGDDDTNDNTTSQQISPEATLNTNLNSNINGGGPVTGVWIS